MQPFDLPLPAFADLVRLFSFSIWRAKSFARSEIDPEDVPKSPPEPAPRAHRRTLYQPTPQRELRVHASENFRPIAGRSNERLDDEIPESADALPAVSRASGDIFGKLFGGAPKRAGGAPALPGVPLELYCEAGRLRERFSTLVLLVTTTDITVWIFSVLLALGIGVGKYAKWKARHELVRDLAAMDRERREKMLSRMNPALAMEARQELMRRFNIF